MSPISPVPTTRVTSQLVTRRLLGQIQMDQQGLFRVQRQVSTGLRIELPSEDAPAALRATTLQQLIERKGQVQINLATGQSFLTATDAALNGVSAMLAEVRGAAMSVLDTISDSTTRQAVAKQVDETIQELLRTGNQRFRGRYLFAGSTTTVQPFEMAGALVRYRGNEHALKSFSDLDQLFETGMHGNEVFGVVSDPVRGSVDLTPVLREDTLLADLRGGQGISQGSIAVSDGTNTSTVNLSDAVTVGDVARLLELHPPATRTIAVTVTATGLTLELDAPGGGNLTVTEVGGGTTAHELGIFEPLGVLTGPLAGQDLNPRLRPTTLLDDIPIAAGGGGPGLDQSAGIRVTNGNQTHEISFATAATVEDLLNILNGSAAGLLAAINQDGTGIDVRSRLSGSDFTIGENGGQTATQLGLRTLTSATPLASLNQGVGVHHTAGTDFVVVRNDGRPLAIDVSDAVTVGDVLDLINEHPDNQDATPVVARLAEYGNGIELVDSNPPGVDPDGQPYALLVRRSLGSLAAIHLGLVPAGADVGLSSGSPAVLTAADVNPQETAGVFNTLIRLRTALEQNDLPEIQRTVEMLDEDITRVNFARAEIGARQQGLTVVTERLQDEAVELKRALSDDLDVDLAAAITELTARQFAFQAALQASAETLQLTLLDYL